MLYGSVVKVGTWGQISLSPKKVNMTALRTCYLMRVPRIPTVVVRNLRITLLIFMGKMTFFKLKSGVMFKCHFLLNVMQARFYQGA